MQPDAELATRVKAKAAIPTEWRLQSALTARWLTEGAVLDGERLFFVAWEVMTDWRINDAHRHWNRPSLDFLFLDATGRLVAVELKRQIDSPRDAWSALCQVTHRALHLARSYNPDSLIAAHDACLSGIHGRVESVGPVKPLAAAHMEFFELETPTGLPGVPVRRAVCAQRFGDCWPAIRDRFASDAGADEVRAVLGRYSSRSNREIARFLAEGIGSSAGLMLPTVSTMSVPADMDGPATVRT